jgi:hypothetical protein
MLRQKLTRFDRSTMLGQAKTFVILRHSVAAKNKCGSVLVVRSINCLRLRGACENIWKKHWPTGALSLSNRRSFAASTLEELCEAEIAAKSPKSEYHE